MPCRCGHTGGPHPCHRCGVAPGEPVLRGQETPYSLAGAQRKMAALETWACAPCRRAGGRISEPALAREA